MKKMLTLGLVLAFMMMFTVGVMADAHDAGSGFDEPNWSYGSGIFADYEAFENFFDSETDIAAEYKTITNARVTGSLDEILYDAGDQDGLIKINTLANIPCYLELELIGNAGYSKLKSLGAGSSGIVDRTEENHWMFFDTNFGGLVNAEWESIGEGEAFSDIGPNNEDREIYIQACDMWTANLYANVDYGFSVSATPLSNGSEELNIEMRHTELNVPGWTEAGVLPTAEPVDPDYDYQVGTWDALEAATVYMQFRVPFDAVPAGAYEGDITFKVYSI